MTDTPDSNAPPPGQITELLRRWCDGETQSMDPLFNLVYPRLRQIANALFRGESPESMLQPTSVVNELFIKLVRQHSLQFDNREHFFSLAASLMRRILVDHARSEQRGKRDGGVKVPLVEATNALKRLIYTGRVANYQAKSEDEMQAVADALSLLANLVMAWNTAKMQAIFDRWARRRSGAIPPELIARIAPTRTEGLNMRGIFSFPIEQYAAALLPSWATPKNHGFGGKMCTHDPEILDFCGVTSRGPRSARSSRGLRLRSRS
jgi:RNA polymerase sigma factor (TIGR02999 family)